MKVHVLIALALAAAPSARGMAPYATDSELVERVQELEEELAQCRATSFGSPILGLDSFCEFVLPKYSSGLLTNSSSQGLISPGSSVEGLPSACIGRSAILC